MVLLFNIWTSDVQQAYLQSAEKLSRDVFISRTVPESELYPAQYPKLFKNLYELCEFRDLWHRLFDEHDVKELGMEPLRSDPALYVLMKDGLFTGLSGVRC